MPQNRLDLLPPDHRLEGPCGRLMAGPAADHRDRLIVLREKGLELAAQVRHMALSEATDSNGKAQAAPNRACVVHGQSQST